MGSESEGLQLFENGVMLYIVPPTRSSSTRNISSPHSSNRYSVRRTEVHKLDRKLRLVVSFRAGYMGVYSSFDNYVVTMFYSPSLFCSYRC